MPKHIAPVGLDVILTDGVTGCPTVIVIPLDVAVGCVTQERLVVITTVITSPLANPAEL